MRTSPSIVPQGTDQDTYLVLDEAGKAARGVLLQSWFIGNGTDGRS
jgi:hypothetical protein